MVVIVTCPNCHEMVILFRNQTIPLKRSVLENGTFEERKEHLAEIIARFFESGGFSFDAEELSEGRRGAPDHEGEAEGDPHQGPITHAEYRRFIELELDCIDDPGYFKKHFRQ